MNQIKNKEDEKLIARTYIPQEPFVMQKCVIISSEQGDVIQFETT